MGRGKHKNHHGDTEVTEEGRAIQRGQRSEFRGGSGEELFTAKVAKEGRKGR
jgi:hypothetical protein